MNNKLILEEYSSAIIGFCIEVHKHLGHGFLEAVYKDALEIEFQKRNIFYTREHAFDIAYKDQTLRRKYYADFTVFDNIILEAKALTGLPDELMSQCINYLKVSNYKLCLLINFGTTRIQIKRIVL